MERNREKAVRSRKRFSERPGRKHEKADHSACMAEANMMVGRLPVRPGKSLRASPSRLNPSTALSSRTGNPLSTVSSYSFHPLPTLDHRSLQLGSKFLQLDYACIANLNDRLFWNHCPASACMADIEGDFPKA